MVIGSQRRTIAQKQFVVEASHRRVWDLLATVVYQLLPLEKVDIVNADSFHAVMKMGIGFIKFPLDVQGKIVDTARPSSYGCAMLVKRGPIKVGVKVVITLRAVDESKTEVFCIAMEEGKRTIMGWVLREPQRKFALNMFDSIAARLQRLCS